MDLEARYDEVEGVCDDVGDGGTGGARDGVFESGEEREGCGYYGVVLFLLLDLVVDLGSALVDGVSSISIPGRLGWGWAIPVR